MGTEYYNVSSNLNDNNANEILGENCNSYLNTAGERHEELVELREKLKQKEQKIAGLQCDIRGMTSRYLTRERFYLTQITNLRNELQSLTALGRTGDSHVAAKWQRRRVNGQDLSQASHEVAVEAFRAAQEPIVVEVLRRVNSNQSNGVCKSTPTSSPSNNKMKHKVVSSSSSVISVSTQTQTDDLFDNTYTSLYRPPTPPPCFISYNTNGLYTPSSRQGVAFSGSADLGGLTDIELAGDALPPYDDEDYDERQYDMEYEEVTLVRSDSQEKIGLTLCYGAAEDDVTDVFISEICPDSIAGMDGRIREGDQILQINYHDVCSRDQAIELFSRSKPQITLLLARPAQIDDGFMEGRPCVLDELHVEMLDQHHHIISYPHNLLQQRLIDEEGATTDTATTENSLHKHGEKDSGVGRTDDSTKNDESSEHELPESESLNTTYTSTNGHIYANIADPDPAYVNDSSIYAEPDMISPEDCEKFREVLAQRCTEEEPQASLSKQDSQSSIEREIALLNKEMEHIQMECEEIVESHLRDQKLRTDQVRNDSPVVRSPRMVPRMGTRLEYVKGPVQGPVDNMCNTTSNDSKKCNVNQCAETRGGSGGTSGGGGGGALTLELNQVEENGNHHGSILCLAADQKPSECTSDSEKSTQTPAQSNKQRTKRTSDGKRPSSRHQSPRGGGQSAHQYQDLYDKYANVMYTNKANLEHTMKVQQQLFQQQMMRRKAQDGAPKLPPRPSGAPANANENCDQTASGSAAGQEMEWVVKRRADGSRYITRRPVRNKMLKERARKVAEERCGMTTDDDAVSEMKTGRYWSKEDRKKHLEKARDHKRRKELMLRARMDTLKETKPDDLNAGKPPVPTRSGAEVNIVELSQRKMMRSKNKKGLDDFTTVQELMAHGNKAPQDSKSSPLLSVTTV